MRIASLLPSATEICAALGLQDALVGVSHECDFPPSIGDIPVLTSARIDSKRDGAAIHAAVRDLMDDGLSIYAVDEARLADLRPTLVLTQDTCDVCAVSFAQVEQAVRRRLGPDVTVVSLSPRSVDDVFEDMRRVAAAAGVQAQGVVERLRARLHELGAATRSRARPTVLHLEWLQPPMVAGHWTPGLLRVAGGHPLLCHDETPTRATDWVSLAASDPDVVVVAPCGYPIAKSEPELRALLELPAWAGLRAVEQGRVFVADGNAYFNRPGPRLVDSAEIAAAMLHPDLQLRTPPDAFIRWSA